MGLVERPEPCLRTEPGSTEAQATDRGPTAAGLPVSRGNPEMWISFNIARFHLLESRFLNARNELKI